MEPTLRVEAAWPLPTGCTDDHLDMLIEHLPRETFPQAIVDGGSPARLYLRFHWDGSMAEALEKASTLPGRAYGKTFGSTLDPVQVTVGPEATGIVHWEVA